MIQVTQQSALPAVMLDIRMLMVYVRAAPTDVLSAPVPLLAPTASMDSFFSITYVSLVLLSLVPNGVPQSMSAVLASTGSLLATVHATLIAAVILAVVAQIVPMATD